jgi:hypothetical protein
MTEPVHPVYASNPFPTCKYRALYPGIEETHFDGGPAKFAEMVYKLSRLDDPPVRLPLHRVALEAARKKGVSFLGAAESWASWSDDVYERRSASRIADTYCKKYVTYMIYTHNCRDNFCERQIISEFCIWNPSS